MSCNLKISFRTDNIISKMRNAMSKAGGTLDGNDTSGEFGLSTPVGDVRGTYKVNGQILEVDISEKPFFVSCDMIEAQIEQYLNK